METPRKIHKRISKKLKGKNKNVIDKEETEKILEECEMIHMKKFVIDDDDDDTEIEDITFSNNNNNNNNDNNNIALEKD